MKLFDFRCLLRSYAWFKFATAKKKLFPLYYAGPRIIRKAKYLKSARGAPQLVEQKLAKKVTLAKMAGPFETIPFHTLRVSLANPPPIFPTI